MLLECPIHHQHLKIGFPTILLRSYVTGYSARLYSGACQKVGALTCDIPLVTQHLLKSMHDDFCAQTYRGNHPGHGYMPRSFIAKTSRVRSPRVYRTTRRVDRVQGKIRIRGGCIVPVMG
jgi:hypothetical protein